MKFLGDLQHKLMLIPIALSKTNTSLHTGAKPMMTDAVTADNDCPSPRELQHSLSLLIRDGWITAVAQDKIH